MLLKQFLSVPTVKGDKGDYGPVCASASSFINWDKKLEVLGRLMR